MARFLAVMCSCGFSLLHAALSDSDEIREIRMRPPSDTVRHDGQNAAHSSACLKISGSGVMLVAQWNLARGGGILSHWKGSFEPHEGNYEPLEREF